MRYQPCCRIQGEKSYPALDGTIMNFQSLIRTAKRHLYFRPQEYGKLLGCIDLWLRFDRKRLQACLPLTLTLNHSPELGKKNYRLGEILGYWITDDCE